VRTLVTGAHGFVGSHLVEALLARGHGVRALVSPWGGLDNLSSVLDHPALDIFRADITDPASLDGASEGIDTVFHAAARAQDWGRWERFYKTNVLGTKHVLEDAQRQGAGRFVFVSSVAVHRYSGFKDADPRSLPRDGGNVNAYARSKILAEDMVMAASGLEPVVVRPGLWLFGPRDPNFIRYVDALHGRSMPALLRALSPSLPIVGSGRAVMNMAYAPNLAHGLVLAGERAAAGKVYVIADEGCPSWLEALSYLADLVGAPRPTLHLPPALARVLGTATETVLGFVLPDKDPVLTSYRAGLMINDAHFSLTAAREELGYQPQLSWQEGMRRTVAALPCQAREP
jgi:nucleoside-diphosphate-sugar epimerase